MARHHAEIAVATHDAQRAIAYGAVVREILAEGHLTISRPTAA